MVGSSVLQENLPHPALYILLSIFDTSIIQNFIAEEIMFVVKKKNREDRKAKRRKLTLAIISPSRLNHR